MKCIMCKIKCDADVIEIKWMELTIGMCILHV